MRVSRSVWAALAAISPALPRPIGNSFHLDRWASQNGRAVSPGPLPAAGLRRRLKKHGRAPKSWGPLAGRRPRMGFLGALARGDKRGSRVRSGPRMRPVSKRGAALGWGRATAHSDRIVVEGVRGLEGVCDVSNCVWWVGVVDGMTEGPRPSAGALSPGPSACHHQTALTSGRNQTERPCSILQHRNLESQMAARTFPLGPDMNLHIHTCMAM